MSSAVLETAGPGPAPVSGYEPAVPIEVIAHDRAYDAHQLRLVGLDWPEIARRVGYLDGRIASMAVNAYLQKIAGEQSHDHRRHALRVELARLDQLQAAYYPAALAGDLAAATFVLKIVHRRCAIMGFDKIEDDLTGAVNTIVIGGTGEEYTAGLRGVIEQDERENSARGAAPSW